ncbi:glycoside hydrolase family 27 protein [Cylindrobasidium torrendii FP15055 ss-10]|uniref:Alpha-galactosidase n=1 Tax=Cylindrobasidium torrendii FP15055 ss-10 TaxID=1314674 RepID=A0A0D7AY55_9AGAR|nr:glycoside hydrolase family 27 protein [Cylindrobasidium torrendii FP15055 ss-10]
MARFQVLSHLVFVGVHLCTTSLAEGRVSPRQSDGEEMWKGVGKLPFMGFNTWNGFGCNYNESVLEENAQLMINLGLKAWHTRIRIDVGYNYVNVDDCYSEPQRNKDGDIVVREEKFPSGMRALTDKIHALGLYVDSNPSLAIPGNTPHSKAGIYGDSGWFTCNNGSGSFQNEERDARLFQVEWGFDLLKFDNCAVPYDIIIQEGQVGKYARMSNAIKGLAEDTGNPPLLFSLCEWGRLQPWLWGRDLGQAWRTTEDIGPRWDSVTQIINQNSFHATPEKEQFFPRINST